MGTLSKILPQKRNLDDVIEKILMIIRSLKTTKCLPPSGTVLRQIVRKLVRDEIWSRSINEVDGFAFLFELDDSISVDPLDPMVLAASIYWEKRLSGTGISKQIDYGAELISAACEVVSGIILREIHGS